MLLRFLREVEDLLNHVSRMMSVATTDPLAPPAGPEKTAARQRRVAAMRGRGGRERPAASLRPWAPPAGPEKTAARQRRVAAMRVREVRDRLTSTSGTRPAFDYELLRQYAQNRLSGALRVVVLARGSGVLSTF